jgi:hypothetical protein
MKERKKMLKKFTSKSLRKIDLSKIKGGDPGQSTDTCEGTTKAILFGLGGYTYDESRDGDWYPMC